MRYLGIDYGRKRVGLSLSDETGTMAFPYTVIPNNEQLVSTLKKIITDEAVAVVVIGHSKNHDGGDNPVHAAAEALRTDLTLATGVPVRFEPEQYTTQEALRTQGRTVQTDAAAAAIILNSYLSRET